MRLQLSPVLEDIEEVHAILLLPQGSLDGDFENGREELPVVPNVEFGIKIGAESGSGGNREAERDVCYKEDGR